MPIRGRWWTIFGTLEGVVVRCSSGVHRPFRCQPFGIWARAQEFAIMRVPAGEMDEWFKSHAWKACIG
jgi:hypothetical protein